MAPTVSRRRFLTYSGAAAVAVTGAGLVWEALFSRARTDPLAPGAGVLHVFSNRVSDAFFGAAVDDRSQVSEPFPCW